MPGTGIGELPPDLFEDPDLCDGQAGRRSIHCAATLGTEFAGSRPDRTWAGRRRIGRRSRAGGARADALDRRQGRRAECPQGRRSWPPSSIPPNARSRTRTARRSTGWWRSSPPKSVRLVGVCIDPDLTRCRSESPWQRFWPEVSGRARPQGVRPGQLGATVTPEAFVIDDQGRIRYHGRIDDQFAARQQRNANPAGNELKTRSPPS